MSEYQIRIPQLIDEKQELLDKVEVVEASLNQVKADLINKQSQI